MGYTAAEFRRRTLKDLTHPDYLGQQMKLHQELMEGKRESYQFQTKNIHKHGHDVYLSVHVTPLRDQEGKISRLIIMAENITDRLKFEKELRDSNAYLKSIYEGSDIGVFVVDVVGDGEYRYIGISPVHEKLMQLKNEDVAGKSPDDLKFHLGEEIPDYIKNVYNKCVRNKIAIESEFFGIIEGKGDWWLNRVTPLINDEGNVYRLIGTGIIITERKIAEKALQASELKFRNYVNHAPDGIVVMNRIGNIVEINDAAVTITGYTRSDLLKMNIMDFHAEDERKEFQNLFHELLVTGKMNGEVTFRRKNGGLGMAIISAVRLSDDSFLSFISDITEMKRLQNLEARAEKLELAGTIAGQIAHDFNNLLGPIMGYPELIHEELPKDHPAHAYLEIIESAAHKIANINQDLLTMSRRGHYSQEVLDLNLLVKQAAAEMEASYDKVTVETELYDGLMYIKGGSAQINRMLGNLLNNACDAMEGAGKIYLKTENYYADVARVGYSRLPKGEYVKLTVRDSGCGIPNEILQKIFDPFFTTKSADRRRGSGLGLSVVDAVVKDHDGYIDIESMINEGTSFTIYLPITRENIKDDSHEELIGGTESMLIVDDDEIQRKVCGKLLQNLGYQVSAVASGEEAVEFLKNNPQDLVILDMIMPGGLDGAQTFQRLREINPKQRTIIISGFSESEKVRRAQRLGAGAFAGKPLTKRKLAAVVRNELDDSRGLMKD